MAKLTRDQIHELIGAMAAIRNGRLVATEPKDWDVDPGLVFKFEQDALPIMAALQDELLELDAQEEEEGDFAPVVGPKTKYDQALVDHVEKTGVVGAFIDQSVRDRVLELHKKLEDGTAQWRDGAGAVLARKTATEISLEEQAGAKPESMLIDDAVKHVLASKNVFVVDEPVLAGSLPPERPVYPKRVVIADACPQCGVGASENAAPFQARCAACNKGS